jgi:hypothetical protein
MKPRIMPLEELNLVLEGEHDVIYYELDKIEKDLEDHNYSEAEVDFKKVGELISQHSIDEQRSLLGFLIEKLGRANSEYYIRVMRGHIQVMKLINSLIRMIQKGEGINFGDIENLKSLLSKQFENEQSLFEEATSIMYSGLTKESSDEIDRYVNEGGK